MAFWVGLLIATASLVYQQVLILKRDRDACFKAFLNNHYVGMAIFIGLLLSYPINI